MDGRKSRRREGRGREGERAEARRAPGGKPSRESAPEPEATESLDAALRTGRADESCDGVDGGGPARLIEDEFAGLKDELEDLNSKWLRALADLDNYKKRIERERCRWADAAREEIVLPLLEVMDNFERAIDCDAAGLGGESGSFRQGVELIFKHLSDVLEACGVRPIDTRGAEFDPNLHEAVRQVESDAHDSNQIVEEIGRGYTMGGRLLRPARVVVAK